MADNGKSSLDTHILTYKSDITSKLNSDGTLRHSIESNTNPSSREESRPEIPKLQLNCPEALWSPSKRLQNTIGGSLKSGSSAASRTVGARKLSESRGVHLPELKLHSSTHNTTYGGGGYGSTGFNKFHNLNNAKRNVGFGSVASAPSGIKLEGSSKKSASIGGGGDNETGSGGDETDDYTGGGVGDHGGNDGDTVPPDDSVFNLDPPPPTGSPVGHFTRRPGFPAPLSAPLSAGGMSNATANASRALLDLCIFLPDRRGIQFTVEGGRLATAGSLLALMFTHRNLPLNLASEAFALWLVSPLLEVQLKPHHVPFQVRRAWPDLLRRFTSVTEDEELEEDEPLLVFRRNVLLSIERQSQIVDEHDGIADLLYADAAESVFSARCLCTLEEAITFGALRMTLDWGPYNKDQHTTSYIRDRLDEILPAGHVPEAKGWSILGWSPVSAWCRGLENELVDQYKQSSSQHSPMKELKKKYLELVIDLPTYGSAIFDGQVERPGHLWGTIRADDLPVRIAINLRHITVVDALKSTILLCQPILDSSWRKINPPDPANPHCFPSFFLHFPDPTNSAHSKLLQIFSKQAVMMEALLNSCIDAFLAANDGESSSTLATPRVLTVPLQQPFRDNTIITKAVADSEKRRGYSETTNDSDNENNYEGEDVTDGNGNPAVIKNGNRKKSRLAGRSQLNGTTKPPHVAFMRGLSNSHGVSAGADGNQENVTRQRNDRAYFSSSCRTNRLDRLCLATIDVETGECIDAVGSLQDCLKDDD